VEMLLFDTSSRQYRNICSNNLDSWNCIERNSTQWLEKSTIFSPSTFVISDSSPSHLDPARLKVHSETWLQFMQLSLEKQRIVKDWLQRDTEIVPLCLFLHAFLIWRMALMSFRQLPIDLILNLLWWSSLINRLFLIRLYHLTRHKWLLLLTNLSVDESLIMMMLMLNSHGSCPHSTCCCSCLLSLESLICEWLWLQRTYQYILVLSWWVRAMHQVIHHHLLVLRAWKEGWNVPRGHTKRGDSIWSLDDGLLIKEYRGIRGHHSSATLIKHLVRELRVLALRPLEQYGSEGLRTVAAAVGSIRGYDSLPWWLIILYRISFFICNPMFTQID
jgi:hypothetical protein